MIGRLLRIALIVLVVLAFVPLLIVSGSRLLGGEVNGTAQIAPFAPLAGACWLAALVVLVLLRSWWPAAVAGLLVAASPLLHITFGTPDQGVLNAGAASRTVADRLGTGFAGDTTSAVTVVLDGSVGLAALTGYAETLSKIPSVVRVESSASVLVQGSAASAGNPALGRPAGQRR